MRYIITAMLFTASAQAADNPNFKQFYLMNGSKVSAEEAILGSLRGKEAYKCQTVEAKVSKSGTSIGIRNVKKKVD